MIEEGKHALLRPGPVIGLVGAQIESRRHRPPASPSSPRSDATRRQAMPARQHGPAWLLLSGGAIVTALSPRLPRGVSTCREDKDASSAVVPANAGTHDRDRVTPDTATCANEVTRRMELNPPLSPIIHIHGSHGPPFRERLATSIRGIGLRQVRLACGVVLFAYLVSHFLNHALGNISMEALATRRLSPHRVLAIPAGRDRVLHRVPGAHRSRHLGAVPAPAIPLEGDRAAAARARPEHSRADHRPHRRRAARPDAVRTRKALSAGALRVLGRVAVPGSG